MPFLATEYAEGPTLSEHVTSQGPLLPPMLHGLAAGLAEALTAIHATGVIHRDLKPGNVLLTPTGPKVIDFGIAQAMDATAVTRTGMTVGSPGFIAPEQIIGQAGPPPGGCAVGGYYTARGHHQRGFVTSQRNGRWGRAIRVPAS
jgi:serine/threonine protein kinase